MAVEIDLPKQQHAAPASATPTARKSLRPLDPPLPQGAPRPVYDAVKAVAEFALAAVLLVLAAPVLALIALAVKLTSRGPVFYSQTRVGKGGRPFTLYKVRTMAHDCEKASGAQWSTPGDPRVTRVGAFLRKTHLDELPQLWNVLRGDMSLVGPRPERPGVHAGAGARHPALPRPPGRAARRHRPGPGPAAARHRPGQRPPKSSLTTSITSVIAACGWTCASSPARRFTWWACPTTRCARCSRCRGPRPWRRLLKSTAGRGRSSRRDQVRPASERTESRTTRYGDL